MFGRKHLVGALLWLLLCYCPVVSAASTQYVMGDAGPPVIQIQSGLKSAGYYGGQIDGKFSTMTRQAVITFQKDVGLKADGIVEEKTFKALTGKEIPAKAASIAQPGMDKNADKILATALSYRGVKYRFGGATPTGFDCSGFVMYVFDKHGIKLPRTADKQFEVGKPIKVKSDLKPGDLVFFETYEKGASHVGIYQGNGQFVHASSSRGITVSGLSDAYFAKRYYGARRIL
ncbi:MAG TPA: NlpC/P60 family protein [Negativicutes bacterium]|nr:NlpC/P60 family protein [Negativicutes bacterium]